MRDILILGIVVVAALITLRRPWVGAMLWVWLSLMNPHRFAFGFAYDAPVSMIAAVALLLGLLFTRDKHSPFIGAPMVLLLAFTVWLTLSWLLGLDRADDYAQWNKVFKINLLIFVMAAVLWNKRDILVLVWVSALSLGLLGAKGGLFTIANGGSYRVWGPTGSFIEDNNEFALALVITIPLLRFLQMQLASRAGRHAMTALMLLCVASAFGSHSRGALLAIAAMALMMWQRSRSKLLGAVVILVVGAAMFSFMPEEWTQRMETIETYEEDRSALGRFSAWWTAWNVALHYPTGVGFLVGRPELFERFSPYGLTYGTPAAHSIYFQVLGNHGFIGLLLYLAMWIATWRCASAIRREAAGIPQAQWCVDFAGMAHVALAGFAVGGAFLSLAYFDLPLYVMLALMLTRAWVRRKAWESDTVGHADRFRVPGLHGPSPPDPKVDAVAPTRAAGA